MNNNKLILKVILFGIVVSAATTIYAQDNQQEKSLPEFLSQFISTQKLTDNSQSQKKEISDIYADILNNTETVNKIYDTFLITNNGMSFLKDMNLKFKTFDVTGKDKNLALGMSYSYDKDISKHVISENATNSTGLSFSINLEGNVAFDKNVNPNNFLDSRISFHFFNSHGGTVGDVAMATALLLNNLEDELVQIKEQQTLDRSPIWGKFKSIVMNNLTTQFYTDFSLNASLESNQDFTQKQYVYGANLGFDLKAWNPNSTLANMNIFDWPFAVIRVFTGYDQELSPRGSVFPTVLLAIQQVNPKQDSIRMKIENDKSYPRFKCEVAFKTRISESAFFVSNFRYYKELGASEAIKNANIAEFLYYTFALTMSNGFYVSYTNGKLPFDNIKDQVYELGFQYKFN